MKKWVLSIFIFCSCLTQKTTTTDKGLKILANKDLVLVSPPMTNQELTDSIIKQSQDIASIRRSFVFLDTMFFKRQPNGTITFRDSIVFNIGVFRKLYVGVDTSHSGVDTLISPPPFQFSEDDLNKD